jgi:hypothetical protein
MLTHYLIIDACLWCVYCVSLTHQARTQVQRKFTVKNPEKTDLVFTVESDLPFISGEATLRIPGGGKADYTLVLNPQVRLRYCWYFKAVETPR